MSATFIDEPLATFSTPLEEVLARLEQTQTNLTAASKLIFFNDIRALLKKISRSVNGIRGKLGNFTDLYKVDIKNDQSMDNDVKAFVLEQFTSQQNSNRNW
jgi:hypothetical protein